jgi:hypothetical protein
VAEETHNPTGNCWKQPDPYECHDCGKGNICDVCHLHDEPRGECSECKRCKVCDEEDTREP